MSKKGDIIEALLGLWRRLPGVQLVLLGKTNVDDVRCFNINLSGACIAARRLVQNLYPRCTSQVFSRVLEVAKLAFEDQAINGKRKMEKRCEKYSPMLRELINLA